MDKKYKLSFDFSTKGVKIFKDIFNNSGLKDWSAMMRTMLRLFDCYLTMTSKGYKLAFIKDEDIQIISDNFGDGDSEVK